MLSNTAKGILTTIGCILIHITLGTMYTIGNINQYLVSYIFHRTGQVVDASLTSWLFSAAFLGVAVTNMVGGILENHIHVKWTVFLGALISSICVFITYFCLENYYLIIVFFGCIFGIGSGIAYSPCLAAGMKWFPKQAGLISGLIVMGFGSGALIFNNVQTSYLNPENLSAIKDEQSGQSFYPESVSERVPSLILILGCCYLVMQIIGILLVFDPRDAVHTSPSSVEASKSSEVSTPRSEGLTTSQAVKTCKFWEIYVFMYFAVLAVLFMSSYYKTLVLDEIKDDQFLALIGSISSLCNGLSRPIWGSLYDKFGYKIVMSIICFIATIFLASLTFVISINQWVYFMWVCIIYFCIGGVFALLPSYTNKSFGSLYMSTNYGWIFTSQALASLTFMFTSKLLITYLGYRGTTILFACLMFIDFLLALFGKKWTYMDHHQYIPTIRLTPSTVNMSSAVLSTSGHPVTPTPFRTPVLYGKHPRTATNADGIHIDKIVPHESTPVASQIEQPTPQNDTTPKKEPSSLESNNEKEEKKESTVAETQEETKPAVEPVSTVPSKPESVSSTKKNNYTVVAYDAPSSNVASHAESEGERSRHNSYADSNTSRHSIIQLSRSQSRGSSSIINLNRTDDPMQTSLLDPLDVDDVIIEVEHMTAPKKTSIMDLFKGKNN